MPTVGYDSVAVSHALATIETPLVDGHTAHLSELENKTAIRCLKRLAGFRRCGPGLFLVLFLVRDKSRKNTGLWLMALAFGSEGPRVETGTELLVFLLLTWFQRGLK